MANETIRLIENTISTRKENVASPESGIGRGILLKEEGY
jgi:hypothetical protein